MPFTGAAAFFLNVFKSVAGAPVVVQRPAVLGAHVAGDVYGDAVDARLTLAVPAAPADMWAPVYQQCFLRAVQTESGAAAVNQIGIILKRGAFATVLGDDAPMALSDAEIADLIAPLNAPAVNFNFPTGNGNPAVLNINVGIAGRRGSQGGFLPIGNVAGFTPGTVIGAYLAVLVAFAPPASESITLYPLWVYSARGT